MDTISNFTNTIAGPPPPSAGQGTGGATKANSEGHNTGSSKQSGGSSSGSSKGTQGAQPKILNENPPKEGEASEDVQKHNRDMENRAERSHEKVNSDEDIEKDKVPKGFWSGTYKTFRAFESRAN